MRAEKISYMFLLMFIVGVIPVQSSTQEIICDPEITFIYPEGLVNGSSYIPRDYIYFTLSGNLGDWSAEKYYISYKWSSSSSWNGIDYLYKGIGLIHPNSDELGWNQWHTLTVRIEKREGGILKEFTFSFYADSSLIKHESFSLTAVNYPNNSIIPYWQGELSEYPTFIATGFNLVEESTLGIHITKKGLKCSYKWDEEDWTDADETFRRGPLEPYGHDYVSYRPNVFTCEFLERHADNSEHILSIKIANDTYSKTYCFNYTIIDNVSLYRDVLGYELNLWLALGKDTTTYGVYGNNQLFPQENISFLNRGNYDSLVYNWHNGEGNHTSTWNDSIIAIDDERVINETGLTISAPNFLENETGVRILSYWYENNSIWSPERRYVYFYDCLRPQIDLRYPVNDTINSGQISLLWSMRTVQQGFWDYSQYQFDLYYETFSNEIFSIESNYNYCAYETKTKVNQNNYWYLHNNLNYHLNCSDPQLWGLVFSIPDELPNNTETIRFIINETTTGLISPVISEWISISPKVKRKENPSIPIDFSSTEETTRESTSKGEFSSSTEIDESITVMVSYTEESSSSTVNKSSWYFNLSIVLFVILIFRKRRND